MAAEINNVLFDLDGTLADTAPDLAAALNRLLNEQGRQSLPFEVIRPNVSHGGIVMICAAFAIDNDDQELPYLRERFLTIYNSCLTEKSKLFEGMEQVLAQLERNNITWGIVTNKPAWLTNPLLQKLGLDDRAACVVSGDTVEHSKPHPAPMLHACHLVNCDPARTVFIGDARRDIQAGHNAGMVTLLAGYGYIGADEDTAAWGADGLVNSPLEILDWLADF